MKSTGDINKHLIKSGEISYPFEVKDLEHWDAQALTIILVVWDIHQKRGWWIWINQAINFLAEANTAWRKKSKVNIHIPIENEFNEAGLTKLRHLLANLYYPIISKGRDLTINAKFSFPNTPNGKEKLAEWQRHFATGDEVELDAKYIETFDFPEWWKRLFGETDPNTRWVKIGPARSKVHRPAQIEFITDAGQAKIPYVELWNVKQGTEEVTFTNDRQNIPIKFLFVFSKIAENRMNINADASNLDSVSVFQMLKIGQVLSAQGIMKLTFLDTGDVIDVPMPSSNFPAPDQKIVDFVEKVSFIQNYLGKKILFPESGPFASYEDVFAVNKLISIIQNGYYQYRQNNMTFSMMFLKAGIEILLEDHRDKEGALMHCELPNDESFVEVFSQKVELGPVTQKI